MNSFAFCVVNIYNEESVELMPDTALSKNFDPHVYVYTLRSKFFCRLVSGINSTLSLRKMCDI